MDMRLSSDRVISRNGRCPNGMAMGIYFSVLYICLAVKTLCKPSLRLVHIKHVNIRHGLQ